MEQLPARLRRLAAALGMLGADVWLQEVCGSQELLLPLSYVPALALRPISHVWLRIKLQSCLLILFSSKTHLFSWVSNSQT